MDGVIKLTPEEYEKRKKQHKNFEPIRFKIEQFLKSIITLPKDIQFYEIDGQIVYPIRSEDGLDTNVIIYLVKQDKTGKWFKCGIQIPSSLTEFLEVK